jgi:predicted GIY-YIG superfamily endonuclease
MRPRGIRLNVMRDAAGELHVVKSPCNLYRHFDAEGALLYVGVSLNTITRLAQHRASSMWFSKIARVDIETFDSREAALRAERDAIVREKPLHNTRHNHNASLVHVNATQVHAEESASDLSARVVQFAPIYTMDEAMRVLEMGKTYLRRLVDEGKIGYVERPGRAGQVRKMFTGWQILEYLEFETRQNEPKRCKPRLERPRTHMSLQQSFL